MNRLEFMTAKEVDAWGLRADQLSKEDFGPRMLVSDHNQQIVGMQGVIHGLESELESIKGSRDSDNRHLVGVIKDLSTEDAMRQREMKLKELDFQLKVAKFNYNKPEKHHFKLEV
jgi:hypothetical protein